MSSDQGPGRGRLRLALGSGLGAGLLAAAWSLPVAAQPYGYGPQSSPTAPGPQTAPYPSPDQGPPPPAEAPPPPPQPVAPPPPPVYGPPGSRCDAVFPGRYHRHRLICPMRVAKPVGAPCTCVGAAEPGYPPPPSVYGHVIP